MASIIGAVATSHIPAIGAAMARSLQADAYWKPFFDGYPPVNAWLERMRPDVAVVIYNDHGLNFFLDKMPTFAVGAAAEYRNADEGWGLEPVAPFPGHPELSWHLIESLVADEFDVTSCQEMLVDHGFTVPMGLLWPERRGLPLAVPISVNTVQHPLPTPQRCYKLGCAVGKAIASFPQELRVVILATGGLSHQLDGERAGFINRDFDLMCMEKIIADPVALTRYSIRDLVERAGSQGVELIMWLMMRGALRGPVRCLHRNYHIPISNTGAGLLLLENAA
jgi:protocatechuate 4,5-dioxygenase, beta chain